MPIPRATTPSLTLTFTERDLDLTAATSVYVTLEQAVNGRSLTKTGEDLTVQEKQIDLFLSQKESLQFLEGEVKIQANWISPDGKRTCSDVKTIMISEQLLRRVIQ